MRKTIEDGIRKRIRSYLWRIVLRTYITRVLALRLGSRAAQDLEDLRERRFYIRLARLPLDRSFVLVSQKCLRDASALQK